MKATLRSKSKSPRPRSVAAGKRKASTVKNLNVTTSENNDPEHDMITNAKQPATGTKAAKQTLVVRQNHQQIPSATSGSGSTSVAATTEGMQSMADAFHALSSVIAGLQPAAASNDGDEQDRLQRTEQASGDASNERKPYEVTRRVEQKLAPVPLPKAPQNEMTAVATAIRNLTTMVARMQPDPVASVQRVRGHGQQRGSG
ncbi:hypothetical protein GN958_ATG20416 [Phytophthora infestans]|uniref:Uncharacterized protein n=1 Tax=Phytophthora infestans TaxID=4787 RepID=A0A8S9TUG5_PHYIN|nr:hypothetical protein GN958_ATG20416 [Phytophthora infestans]